ncbi:MAG: glycoside hydrolase family 44 protein [Terracidiphilus sp.]|nr:glycoside hydrolase family 44 protein [Terracidiphilus sp.]
MYDRSISPSILLVLSSALALALLPAGCGGGGSGSSTPVTTTYTLTVQSTSPSSGVAITISPADVNGSSSGSTSLTRTYDKGSTVTLTAPSTSGPNTFSSWSGCTTASTVTCTVTLNANTTVTAAYNAPTITVTPSASTALIGTQVQFSASVSPSGALANSFTWSVAAPSGSTLSPGTMTSTGLYTTPYPAPATVTVTATSTVDTSVSGSTTLTLAAPAVATGPALTVDAADITHAINPLIYGMNAFTLSSTVGKAAHISVDRWGGDATSRYNYLLDVTNAASDWYFENNTSGTGSQDTGAFNQQVASDAAIGAKTIGTIPVLGYVAKDGASCSFPSATYPSQVAFDPYRPAASTCGDGLYPQGTNSCTSASGCNITGVAPSATSTAVDSTWAGNWVSYLVGKFGSAASGGVAIYDLDNEPAWWDAVHRDVHPSPSTYDEVTNNGIAAALAIKNADPTAEVSGPVVDYWWNYFYSKKDIENGWGNGSPCWQPWSNPTDRNAHAGKAFIEYYLQQFKAAETTYSKRLLDYVDLHTYFVASYNGSSLGFAKAGDTGAQQARLNSTRVFWDSAYTDPNYPQPNYTTDSNYTSSCTVPLQAPEVIPMMKNWVANNYPGTKLAITEYNWGGQEHINGALAQADILGIFGREGLDIGTLWGAPDATTQIPGLMAFEIYRNYDGANSTFGGESISTSSGDQSKLAVYAAQRTSDNKLTLIVINKTYGDLTSTLSLGNFTPNGQAQVYQYSNANLNAIVAQSPLTITAPTGSSTTSTVTTTFPAQSITLLVIPQ